MTDQGPVQLPKGKVIGKRWKVLRKLGEGGCGAVYKVQDINSNKETPDVAALKAESNYVSGGSVLKLEVAILRRLSGRPHVAQLIQCGKKAAFSYMVMTLLGEPLSSLVKCGRQSSVSTQIRVGINTLFGVKQIHDIGFVHRDLKPANIAVGRVGSATRFMHILDFGLAREFVVIDDEDKKVKMRRPRYKALFRGTTRYCSVNTHDRLEQGRVDDLWSLLYMLAELRGTLPWSFIIDKNEVAEHKRNTDFETLLENSPVELIKFGQHLQTLTYYSRPDYVLLFNLMDSVMTAGKFKWSDNWDWERGKLKSAERICDPPTIPASKEKSAAISGSIDKVVLPHLELHMDEPFPREIFQFDTLGF